MRFFRENRASCDTMEDLYLNLIKEANGTKFQNLKSAAQCAYGKKERAGGRKYQEAVLAIGLRLFSSSPYVCWCPHVLRSIQVGWVCRYSVVMDNLAIVSSSSSNAALKVSK